MEQFSLEKYLENPSRKVLTRDGREVDIYYSPTSRIPLIGATTSDNEIHQYTKDGFQCDTFNQAKNDLFFADEEDELTEFEKEVKDLINSCCNEIGETIVADELAKDTASALLDLARNEILRDLPKWKRNKPNEKYIHNKGYYLTWNELENLPKEE